VFGFTSKPLEDVTSLSATRLADLIHRKEVSSREVIDAHIERIEDVNPKILAVAWKAYDRARREADAADKAIRQGRADRHRQPLLGVPVTIKDQFETEGVRSSCGLPALQDNVPVKDATAVHRLRQAGAIILGKSNVPTFCVHFETENPVNGRTDNPYDRSRTPGGSSGGEAAVIAACGSPLGLGTDGGGSIRLPAHFCGIAGLRPAWGRVPLSGSIKATPRDYGRYVTAGPMARYTQDLALMLPVISGPDPGDPFTFPAPLRCLDSVDMRRLRVSIWNGEGVAEIPRPTDETLATVANAASALEDAGATVVDAHPPHLDRLLDIFDAVFDPEKVLQDYPESLKQQGVEPPGKLDLQLLEHHQKRNTRIPVEQKEMARKEWLPKFQSGWLEFLDTNDVLICPVNSFPAMKHYTTWQQIYAFGFTLAVSLVPKVPAGSVRCGWSDEGLPIGVQVVSKPFREDIVLAVMNHLENQFGGWQPSRA
jgi:amidase